MADPTADRDRATRRLWPALALPGTFWLVALFLVPFYAVMAVAFGGSTNIFGEPIPAWNPLDWQFATFAQVLSDSVSGPYRAVWLRTALYTGSALLICVVVGYPVAYYTARLAGKRRGLVLALILAPWWINYITRMLAWVNLLQDDGYVNRALGDRRHLAGLLVGRQPRHRRDRPRLRLPAVLHHPAVRVARQDRPAAARGVARPRRRARSAPSCT